MPTAKTPTNQIRALKQELRELELTLRQLGSCRMDEGVAILFRYITTRVYEIAMQWYKLTRESPPSSTLSTDPVEACLTRLRP